jgi:hypothetical protein
LISSVVVGFASGPSSWLPRGPGGVEVRALLGKVDLFVVDRKGSCSREDRGMGTRMRMRKESRRMWGACRLSWQRFMEKIEPAFRSEAMQTENFLLITLCIKFESNFPIVVL